MRGDRQDRCADIHDVVFVRAEFFHSQPVCTTVNKSNSQAYKTLSGTLPIEKGAWILSEVTVRDSSEWVSD